MARLVALPFFIFIRDRGRNEEAGLFTCEEIGLSNRVAEEGRLSLCWRLSPLLLLLGFSGFYWGAFWVFSLGFISLHVY